jgi:hypothetical protein
MGLSALLFTDYEIPLPYRAEGGHRGCTRRFAHFRDGQLLGRQFMNPRLAF